MNLKLQKLILLCALPLFCLLMGCDRLNIETAQRAEAANLVIKTLRNSSKFSEFQVLNIESLALKPSECADHKSPVVFDDCVNLAIELHNQEQSLPLLLIVESILMEAFPVKINNNYPTKLILLATLKRRAGCDAPLTTTTSDICFSVINRKLVEINLVVRR